MAGVGEAKADESMATAPGPGLPAGHGSALLPEHVAKVVSEKAVSMSSAWHKASTQPGFPKG